MPGRGVEACGLDRKNQVAQAATVALGAGLYLAPASSKLLGRYRDAVVIAFLIGAGRLMESLAGDAPCFFEYAIVAFQRECFTACVAHPSRQVLAIGDHFVAIERSGAFFAKFPDGNAEVGAIGIFAKVNIDPMLVRDWHTRGLLAASGMSIETGGTESMAF